MPAPRRFRRSVLRDVEVRSSDLRRLHGRSRCKLRRDFRCANPQSPRAAGPRCIAVRTRPLERSTMSESYQDKWSVGIAAKAETNRLGESGPPEVDEIPCPETPRGKRDMGEQPLKGYAEKLLHAPDNSRSHLRVSIPSRISSAARQPWRHSYVEE